MAVSPDNSIVFVTGHSKGRGTVDYVTIAYDASIGNAIWRKRFDGGRNDYAVSIVASPDGANVYVTGFSRKPGQRADYLTVAMDVVTGEMTWHKRYNGPNDLWDTPSALVTSPDSSTLFVTGTIEGEIPDADFSTIAYDASTGSRRWVRLFDGGLAPPSHGSHDQPIWRGRVRNGE